MVLSQRIMQSGWGVIIQDETGSAVAANGGGESTSVMLFLPSCIRFFKPFI